MALTNTFESHRQSGDAAPVRLVIIDDHKLLRDGLRALFSADEDRFLLVGEAGTAHDGYALVERARPDLVLLDLHLPDQSGARLAAEIRSAWPQVRILILSGSAQPIASEIARSGADGFVRKEDAADELMRAIPVIMSGKSYFSPVAADAIARGLWTQTDSKVGSKVPHLTEREREVLRGFAEGLSYKEIAAKMHISVRTAETYRARLVQKLGCNSRAELVRCAIRHGLVVA